MAMISGLCHDPAMSFVKGHWSVSTVASVPDEFHAKQCVCLDTYLAYPQISRDTVLEEALNLRRALAHLIDVHEVSLAEGRPGVLIQLKETRSLGWINFILPPDWIMKKIPEQVPEVSVRASVLKT